MANSAEIHLNDIGTIFRTTILDETDTAVDVSGATTKQLIFRKPSGTILTKTADFYTDGTDGIIQYSSQNGDLDEIGSWKIQGYVAIPGGSWKTNITSFDVVCNL